MTTPEYETKARKRFIAKVKRNNSTGCYNWVAAKTPFGYGYFVYDGKPRLTHRFSAWKFGLLTSLSDPGLVCHKCDNPSCIRPSHLFIGTQQDNMRDARNKKRVEYDKMGKKIFGSGMYNSKLNEDMVREIRGLSKDGWTNRQLAERYDVDRKTIWAIVRRTRWKHIDALFPHATCVRINCPICGGPES